MYKCDRCGGDLKYDIESKSLKCRHCNHVVSIRNYKLEHRSAEQALSVFSCPYCGAEICTNDTSISDFCSYCGSPTLLDRREMNVEMPKRIVPFEVTLKECEARYMEYIEKMPYVPDEYKSKERTLDFRGIYVPFHSYSVDVAGEVVYNGKVDTYEGHRKHKVDIYKVDSKVSGAVEHIVHDASKIFSDEASEAISSGSNGRINFNPAYLSGFYADLADVPADEYEAYATARVKSMINEDIEDRTRNKYKKSRNIDLSTKKKDLVFDARYEYDILRPVWFMSRKTNGRVAYAVVNGKTKDMVADLPIDTKKLVKLSLITSLVLFVVLQMLFTWTPKETVGFSAIFDLILTWVYFSNVGKLYKREILSHQFKYRKSLALWKKIVLGIVIGILMLFFVLPLFVIFASGAGFCAFLFLLELILLTVYARRWRLLGKHGTHTTKWIWVLYLASALLIALAAWSPVHDYWYYVGSAMSLVVTIIVMFRTIHDYNLICSQPLPQFKAYKGGMQRDEM